MKVPLCHSALQDLDSHTCEAIIFRLLHLCCKLLRIHTQSDKEWQSHQSEEYKEYVTSWRQGIHKLMNSRRYARIEVGIWRSCASGFVAIATGMEDTGSWVKRCEERRRHVNDVRNHPAQDKLSVPGHSVQALNSQSFGLSHLMFKLQFMNVILIYLYTYMYLWYLRSQDRSNNSMAANFVSESGLDGTLLCAQQRPSAWEKGSTRP